MEIEEISVQTVSVEPARLFGLPQEKGCLSFCSRITLFSLSPKSTDGKAVQTMV
jgi:formylmethanofuran dehydrogenase subunit A